MDMFDAKRRDNPSMEKFMDQKKPGFGGPSSAIPFEPNKKKTQLSGYQRVVERDPKFEGGKFNTNYDHTWKAVTRDIISRQANKKPFEPMYAKPTIATAPAVEEGRIFRFEEFVNESEFNMFAEAEDDDSMAGTELDNEDMTDDVDQNDMENQEEEVDEEQLEKVMEDHKEQITDMIDEIAEKMEIEKEEVAKLLKAAIKKIVEEPQESEEEEVDEDDEFGTSDTDEDTPKDEEE